MPPGPPAVKLGAIDLNLLVVFDAVMQERSVTRADQRLGLSQPAMSHALARLRHMLKDELFVRSPKGMLPTPRAGELATPVRTALDGLQQSLEPAQFYPTKASRRFRIAVDKLEILDLLDRGDLDLAIGTYSPPGERFSHRPLLKDEFVAVLGRNHSATQLRQLSIEKFAALPHLDISSVLHATDFIDEALARRKLSRRIALRAPFLSATRILGSSDMVSVFPRRIATELTRHRPLAIRALPLASPVIETAMIWPRWLDNQPAHSWLRDVVVTVCAEALAE
jgi:DNA-binding transcriptional LysR family regulator